jgi:hypothetical protein
MEPDLDAFCRDESRNNDWWRNSFSTDIGNRRLRFLAYAQVSKIHDLNPFGINNQTFINGGAAGTSGTGGYGAGKKPGLFFHDAWNEYAG